jgi:hypothetical protein
VEDARVRAVEHDDEEEEEEEHGDGNPHGHGGTPRRPAGTYVVCSLELGVLDIRGGSAYIGIDAWHGPNDRSICWENIELRVCL